VARASREAVKLSIVIPANNEARRLPATLVAIAEYLEGSGRDAEVLVVDDGSTDGTAEAARAAAGRGMPPRVLVLDRNRGKGAAVREGMLAARGDYVLFMDADNSTHIAEVERLLAVAEAGAPVVVGSRYIDRESIKIRQPWYRVALSRVGNRIIQMLVLRGVRDTQCGFKLFRRPAAHTLAARLTRERFSFDMELLVIAKSLGYEVREVPVNWYDTPGTRLRPIRSALRTLTDLLRIRWNLWRHRYAEERLVSAPLARSREPSG
jgi:dolichyl-phosphate beta-glucosyltransferase